MAAIQARLRRVFSTRTITHHDDRVRVHNPLRIPDEIVLNIIMYISPWTILSLSQVSQYLRALLLPKLYASVLLSNTEQCYSTLRFLAQNPCVARSVKQLIISPGISSEEFDDAWTVRSIETIASVGYFTQLHTFRWEGNWLPPDSLWLMLRDRCPMLRHIGCTPACAPLPLESGLYSFSNLSSFSLAIRHFQNCPLDRNRDSRSSESLPDQLCDMLLNRCPELEALELDVSHSWDVGPLMQGRWSKLRSLKFDFELVGGVGQKKEKNKVLCTQFLGSHPNLQTLSIGEKGYNLLFLLDLPSEPPTSAASFCGRMGLLNYRFPDALTGLQHLILPSELYDFSVSDDKAVNWNCLRSLPCLQSLKISLRYREQDDVNYTQRIHSLLDACPNLMHLDISILPHIVISDFSRALSSAPQLKSFILTTVRKITDGGLRRCALKLARRHIRLSRFSIRYAQEWGRVDHLILKQKADFEVERGTAGTPGCILGREVSYHRGRRSEKQTIQTIY